MTPASTCTQTDDYINVRRMPAKRASSKYLLLACGLQGRAQQSGQPGRDLVTASESTEAPTIGKAGRWLFRLNIVAIVVGKSMTPSVSSEESTPSLTGAAHSDSIVIVDM
jgi:hypothetical protein